MCLSETGHGLGGHFDLVAMARMFRRIKKSTLGNCPKSLPDLFGFKEVGVLFVAQLLQYMVSQTLATDALDLQRV